MAGTIQVCKDFVQGDSFYINLTHTPAIELANAVFTLTLKNKEDATTAAMETSYIVPASADATNGIANIPIPTTDTVDVRPGEYFASLTRAIGTELVTLIQSGVDNARKVVVYKRL